MKNNLLIAIVLLIMGCTDGSKEIRLPYYTQVDFTPQWMSPAEAKNIHTVADFSLTNQEGEEITNDDLKGKIYVANFFFTICPTICPKMTNNLQRIQETFPDDPDVLLVSHTVMPWMDSVQVLKEFAERNAINSNKWHLLTGDKELIYSLGRTSYFADEGFGKSVTDESDFLHTENIILVDADQHIRGVYNGTLPLEMARLIEDIERLKQENLEAS